MSLLSRERTQIFMTSFYNSNCISNCFSLSATLLCSPQRRWAVLGFMKSTLSQMKSRRGFVPASHVFCLSVLCSEAGVLAGGQSPTCSTALAKKMGLAVTSPPQRSGSQGSNQGRLLRLGILQRQCTAGFSASVSPPRNVFPPKLASCDSAQQKPISPFFFFF